MYAWETSFCNEKRYIDQIWDQERFCLTTSDRIPVIVQGSRI